MAKKKAAPKKKFGFFNIILLVVNIAAILLLLLSYLAVHISPSRNWALPFFSLTYPYLLLVNIGFVIFWAIFRKWVLLLSLCVILAGWNHMGRIFRLAGNHELTEGYRYFKLTSYNVKNLSNDNVDLVEPEIRTNIIKFLDGTGSDLICMQEMMIVHPNPDAFIDSLSYLLNLPYHAYAQYYEKKSRFIDAIFTFSRYPIVQSGQIALEKERTFAIFSDIEVGSDTFRLFNVHLESFRLRHEDYSFISELDLQFEKDENIRENSVRILKKFKTAFQKRSRQADILSAEILKSPYPVIIAGDFNDTPNSYVYHRLSRGMTDAFMESGAGFGNTYLGKVPSFRIDYIFHSNTFQSRSFRRGTVKFSDHYPVSCYIGWPESTQMK